MKPSSILLAILLPLSTLATPLTLPPTTAFLHLDLLALLVSTFVVPFPEGQTFIASEALLLSTLHSLNPQPLNIFTRIYFSTPTGYPELGTSSPFYPIVAPLLPLLATDPGTEIYSAFPVEANDTVLAKYRYFAGAGNALELILNTNGITTVVISGVRTSGVVLATAMRLFDGDYDVIVVRDCTLETPVGPQADMIQESILGTGGVIEKMGGQVVMLADVLTALEGWGG